MEEMQRKIKEKILQKEEEVRERERGQPTSFGQDGKDGKSGSIRQRVSDGNKTTEVVIEDGVKTTRVYENGKLVSEDVETVGEDGGVMTSSVNNGSQIFVGSVANGTGGKDGSSVNGASVGGKGGNGQSVVIKNFEETDLITSNDDDSQDKKEEEKSVFEISKDDIKKDQKSEGDDKNLASNEKSSRESLKIWEGLISSFLCLVILF